MSASIESHVEIRGHSRLARPASLGVRFLSGLFDVCLGLGLVEIVYLYSRLCFGLSFGLEPVLDAKLALIAAGAVLLPWLAGRVIAKRSLGESLWRIQGGKSRARDASDRMRASFLTLAAFAGVAIAGWTGLHDHPYWSVADEILIPAVVPPSEWRALSFYYTLAPWPVSFKSRPIFYSLPYEQGPPKRFVGHIEAEWIPDSVRVTLEGPKTPMEYQSRARTRAELRACFTASPLTQPSCAESRRVTLTRPEEELRAQGYAQFEARWFSAENPLLPNDERAQGVLLRARAPGGESGSLIQERYILITPLGIHQSLAISYPDTSEGHEALAMFQTVLGALRISESLDPGRAWVDNLLASTKLDRLPEASSSPDVFLPALAQVQAALVSKISVSPGSFPAYYHLAGIHELLLKYTAQHPDPELKNLSQAMMEHLGRYSHDVGPNDAMLPEMDRMTRQAAEF